VKGGEERLAKMSPLISSPLFVSLSLALSRSLSLCLSVSCLHRVRANSPVEWEGDQVPTGTHTPGWERQVHPALSSLTRCLSLGNLLHWRGTSAGCGWCPLVRTLLGGSSKSTLGARHLVSTPALSLTRCLSLGHLLHWRGTSDGCGWCPLVRTLLGGSR